MPAQPITEPNARNTRTEAPVKGYTQSMNRLMEELGEMPGIGAKSAERLAYHILRSSTEEAMRLAYAIRDVKKNVKHCSKCFNIAEGDPCEVCADPKRDRSVICVVEQPKDLIALEKAGAYRGIYHVLLGHIAPLDGRNPEDLTADKLVERARLPETREIIIATNPNSEGEMTALYVYERLEGCDVQVTRIARGIPSGSQLEFASASILADAMEGRREM